MSISPSGASRFCASFAIGFSMMIPVDFAIGIPKNVIIGKAIVSVLLVTLAFLFRAKEAR